MRVDGRVWSALEKDGWRLRWLPEVDSTNRVVADAAREGEAQGLVVAADHQTAGRGRLDRPWDAPAGTALLASILLRPDLHPSRLHLVTAAVGLSAAAVLAARGVSAELKWPNDLLVGEAKLAGILAEAVGGAVVVGIGVNLSAAPAGAAAADVVAGRPIDAGDLLAGVLGELSGRLGRWDEVVLEYEGKCATVGRRVRVERAAGALVGRASRVEADGALVVTLDATGEEVAVSAGDVIHLRPAP